MKFYASLKKLQQLDALPPAFALKPLEVATDKKSMEVQFFWLALFLSILVPGLMERP